MKKVAFITGATSGIGKEIAVELQEKYSIVNFSRTSSQYENFALDLADKDAYKFIVEKTLERKPNVIVLNAGMGHFMFVKDIIDVDALDKLVLVNASNYIKYLTKIWPYLIENKVKILVVSSVVAHLSGAAQSYYALTKKMLNSFVDSLRTELHFYGSKSSITEFVMHFTGLTNLNPMINGGDLPELQHECRTAVAFMENGAPFYLPKQEIYRRVMDKYYQDPLAQGISSLEYRMKSGRVTK